MKDHRHRAARHQGKSDRARPKGYVVDSVGQVLQDNDGKERPKTPKDLSVDDDETFLVER